MTDNLLKEAMDCGWVTIGFRVPPPPELWEFVVDLRRRNADAGSCKTLRVSVWWSKVFQPGPGGVYHGHVYLREEATWCPNLAVDADFDLAPVEGFTKPEVNWAKKAAEIAIKQAVAEGKLSATEHDLGDHAKKDWRNWREWHD